MERPYWKSDPWVKNREEWPIQLDIWGKNIVSRKNSQILRILLRGDDSDIFISDDWSRAERIERHMPELWRWKELGIFDATVEIQVDHKELSGSHSGYESRMPGSGIWSRPRSQTSMSPRRGNLLFIDKILI